MNYRLHNADCSDALREYAAQAHLVLTSPPYDALRTYGGQG